MVAGRAVRRGEREDAVVHAARRVDDVEQTLGVLQLLLVVLVGRRSFAQIKTAVLLVLLFFVLFVQIVIFVVRLHVIAELIAFEREIERKHVALLVYRGGRR